MASRTPFLTSSSARSLWTASTTPQPEPLCFWTFSSRAFSNWTRISGGNDISLGRGEVVQPRRASGSEGKGKQIEGSIGAGVGAGGRGRGRGAAGEGNDGSRRGYATAVDVVPPVTTIRGGKKGKGPKGILMMNMGGPATVSDTHSYLLNLFSDPDLIPLPFQSYLAPIIAKNRTPRIEQQYQDIGGGSPILKWTREQGAGMVKLVEEIRGEGKRGDGEGGWKDYVAFRYVDPLTSATVDEMLADGVTRAVAFSQYPQYSCSTTGSSLNELWKVLKEKGAEDEIQWSVIDRWPTHPGLVEAISRNIIDTLSTYPPEHRSRVVILFSAHSLPMSVVNRGDPYPAEVAATVHAVMTRLGFSNPYRLVWQSQVGPSAWLGQQTNDAIKGLAKQGKNEVMLVPVAFTSDHIETLYELDLEYLKEAKELGMTGVKRCPSLNGDPTFIRALADIVCEHLDSKPISTQMMLRCPGCSNTRCADQKQWFNAQSDRIR